MCLVDTMLHTVMGILELLVQQERHKKEVTLKQCGYKSLSLSERVEREE